MPTAKINRLFFFQRVRSNLFVGKLNAAQTNGLTTILDAWEKSYASNDDRWLAYALATTFHETAFTMQPIHEYGGNSYFFNSYDINGSHPKRAKALGNLKKGDGVLFHGRGYVQLTGRSNYQKVQNHIGVDLTSNSAAADRVMNPEIAIKVLLWGMEVGLFTGKKFGDYFNGQKQSPTSARYIINGQDQAAKIAQYWYEFYGAISYTTG